MAVNSETRVLLKDPAGALEALLKEVGDEHGIELDEAPNGERFYEIGPFRLGFKVETRALHIKLAGPTFESLAPIKEDVISHMADIDSMAAEAIRWTGEQVEIGTLPPSFKVLTVVRTSPISSTMQRVTLSGPDMGHMAKGGTHIRLMLPLARDRKPIWPRMAANGAPEWPKGDDKLHARFVTLKSVRVDANEADLDIVRHNGGLISDWANSVGANETVGVMGPIGLDQFPSTRDIFLAADETGLAFISRFIEIAGEDATGNAVVAASPDLDLDSYMPRTKIQIESMAPDVFPSKILQRATELTPPDVTTYAHFAGEFENAQALRKMFKSRLGLDKNNQMSVAYWRKGVPGFGS